MPQELSIEDYIARQPQYDKARRVMHPLLRGVVPSFCKLDVRGLDNVPRRGRTCLMINHVSYLDPIVVTVAIPFRHTVSLSKVENFGIPVAGWFLRQWGHYPIHRGEYDRKALMQTIALLKSGQLVLMAPEGTRHPQGMQRAKEGLAYVATKADAVIVPTAICGAEDWRRRLKRFRRAYAKVVFGAPFRFRSDGRKRIPRNELTEMITQAMHQLAKTIPDEYAHLRGYYSDIEKAGTDRIEFAGDDPNLF
ncbi:MAG: lysophospholipid acyltransferase family protein [Chloroflexota bacterium]|nr:lysophospholipid acyltransferase family protein [Chloroflexota bacterium]